MSTTLSAKQRAGRIGGLTTSTRNNPLEYTAKARATFHGLDYWLRDIPTDLPHEERVRRAEAKRRLHFVEMGRKGGLARSKSKGSKKG